VEQIVRTTYNGAFLILAKIEFYYTSGYFTSMRGDGSLMHGRRSLTIYLQMKRNRRNTTTIVAAFAFDLSFDASTVSEEDEQQLIRK
jgi:hypothetical protein